MQRTKTIALIVATSLVIMAAIGVTYAQLVNAQAQNNNYYSQTPPQAYNGNYGYLPSNCYNGASYCPYPQQGCYSYGIPQGASPYQYGMGMGMGMSGRGW